MSVVVEKAGLSYVSVPKCACTALKLFCYEVQNGRSFADDNPGQSPHRIHKMFPSRPFRALKDEDWPKGDLIAVVRDPVARIYSLYTNKVLKVRALEKEPAEKLAEFGLESLPDFETFVERLDDYNTVSGIVQGYSRPLRRYLGTRADRFAALFDMSDLGAFAALVNDRAGTTVTLGTENNTSKLKRDDAISGAAREMIETRFETDYAYFGHVFKNGRDSAPARISGAA